MERKESTNKRFFIDLQPVKDFSKAFVLKNFEDAPGDWLLVLTDVVNSTQAIEQGRYKDVNTAGGLTAMALGNLIKDFDYPFIFGGDGLTALLPPDFGDLLLDVLSDTKSVVKKLFDLELRVAVVSVSALYARGLKLKVGKLRVSPYYNQALIWGNGLETAEQWLKDPKESAQILISGDRSAPGAADFSGYTCRWQDVPSPLGETLSLVIKPRFEDWESMGPLLEEMEKILSDKGSYHPLAENSLKWAHSSAQVLSEAKVKMGQAGGFTVWWAGQKILWQNRMARLIAFFRLPARHQWRLISELRHFNIVSSDFRKFDGTIKMVASVDSETRKKLEALLETKRKAGQIYYGMHIANRALMTCVLHAGTKREVHFLDGADGGYTLAAKAMKNQILEV